jgi:DNA invertase Pin-like site-specific DNA recombinase
MGGGGMGAGKPGDERVDGYVRISRVGDRRGERFISPVVQREEIEAWARAHAAEIIEVFYELDESGRRADRPLWLEAIGRIERGVTTGLVVATVDRFGRNELDALVAIGRVHAAGGHFYSAREDLDLATDAGRLLCHVLLSVAEFQSDRTQVGWQQAKEKMIARGAWPASAVPYGYRRTRGGRLRPDPVTADVVSELFRRRARGESMRALCRHLRETGVLSPRGQPGWSPHTLGGLFHRRVYLGEINWGGIRRLDAHPALIDAATFQRANRPPQHNRRRSATAPLLAGLVRCAGCSMSMSGCTRRSSAEQPVIYRCYGASVAGPCPAPAFIRADRLEPYVTEVAFGLLARRHARSPHAAGRAREALDAAEAALRRYRDNDALVKRVDAAVFAAGMAVRYDRVKAAQLDLALAEEADDLTGLPTPEVAERDWLTLAPTPAATCSASSSTAPSSTAATSPPPIA